MSPGPFGPVNTTRPGVLARGNVTLTEAPMPMPILRSSGPKGSSMYLGILGIFLCVPSSLQPTRPYLGVMYATRLPGSVGWSPLYYWARESHVTNESDVLSQNGNTYSLSGTIIGTGQN